MVTEQREERSVQVWRRWLQRGVKMSCFSPLSKCLPPPLAAPHAALDPTTYHGDFEGIDVERVNLPVAANIVDKFDESVDPENPSYHQDADKEAVCLDSASKKRQVVRDRPRQVPKVPEKARAVANMPSTAPTLHCRHLEARRHLAESP